MRNDNVVTKEKQALQLFNELHKPQFKTEYTYLQIAQRFGVSMRTAKRYVSNGKNSF